MSLINDALKRASEAEKRHAGLSSSGPGVRRSGRRGPKGPEALGPPIKAAPKRRRGPAISPALAMGIIALCLAIIGGKLVHNWWSSRDRFVLRNLPDGVDPLEAMIVQKKKSPEEKGILHVSATGVELTQSSKSKEATNNVSMNVAAALTNAIPTPSVTNLSAPTVVKTNVVTATTNDASPAIPSVPKAKGPVMNPTPVVPKPPAKTLIVAESNPGSRSTKALKTALNPNTTDPRTGPVTTAPASKNNFDGTMKTVGAEAEFPAIQLQGIIITKSKATAFVNNKTMRIGDFVKDAELVEIALQYVKFSRKGVEKRYFLLR